MNNFIDMKKCCELLEKAEDVLILTHKSPDGDTIGSAFGLMGMLRDMGKRVKVLCSDPIPKKYAYFTEKFSPEDFEPRYIISVDVAETELLGENLKNYGDKIDLAIDHHRTHRAFAENIYVNADAPATAEIIYSISAEMGRELSTDTANALFTGICTDTGGFKYPGTSPYTHRAAARLMEFGAESAKINKIIFNTKSKEKLAIEKKVLDTLKFYFDGKCAVTTIFEKDMAESGATEEDMEGIASIPSTIENVELGITLKEKEGGFKVSMRSNEYADVSKLCGKFGGGGHIRAAGCFIADSYENVLEKVLKAAEEIFE